MGNNKNSWLDEAFLRDAFIYFDRKDRLKNLQQWLTSPDVEEEKPWSDEEIYRKKVKFHEQLQKWNQETPIREVQYNQPRRLPYWRVAATILVILCAIGILRFFTHTQSTMTNSDLVVTDNENEDKIAIALELHRLDIKPYIIDMSIDKGSTMKTINNYITSEKYSLAIDTLRAIQATSPDSMVQLTLAFALAIEGNNEYAQEALAIFDGFRPDVTSSVTLDWFKSLAYLSLRDTAAIRQIYVQMPESQTRRNLKTLLDQIE